VSQFSHDRQVIQSIPRKGESTTSRAVRIFFYFQSVHANYSTIYISGRSDFEIRTLHVDRCPSSRREKRSGRFPGADTERGASTAYICSNAKHEFTVPANGGGTWIRDAGSDRPARRLIQNVYGNRTLRFRSRDRDVLSFPPAMNYCLSRDVVQWNAYVSIIYIYIYCMNSRRAWQFIFFFVVFNCLLVFDYFVLFRVVKRDRNLEM